MAGGISHIPAGSEDPRIFSEPCRFLDPLSPSLVWTAEDLRKARPDISVDEIADLLGVTPENVHRLRSTKVSFPPLRRLSEAAATACQSSIYPLFDFVKDAAPGPRPARS